MTDTDLIKAIGSAVGGGAVAGALLLILYRITQRIVERIAAIDRIAVKVDGIETKAAERHAESGVRHAAVREELVKLDAKVTSAIDWRERTAPYAAPDINASEEHPSERRRKVRARSPVGE